MDIRDIVGELVKETSRIIAELGRAIYRPMGLLLSPFIDILKECHSIFSIIADLGAYVFAPMIRASLPRFPARPREGEGQVGAAGEMLAGFSLRPNFTYTINLVRRLPSSLKLASGANRLPEGLESSIKLSETISEAAEYTRPVALVGSQLAEPMSALSALREAYLLPLEVERGWRLAAPVASVVGSFAPFRRSLEVVSALPSRKIELPLEEAIEVSSKEAPKFSDVSEAFYMGSFLSFALGFPAKMDMQAFSTTYPIMYSKTAGLPIVDIMLPAYPTYAPVVSVASVGQVYPRTIFSEAAGSVLQFRLPYALSSAVAGAAAPETMISEVPAVGYEGTFQVGLAAVAVSIALSDLVREFRLMGRLHMLSQIALDMVSEAYGMPASIFRPLMSAGQQLSSPARLMLESVRGLESAAVSKALATPLFGLTGDGYLSSHIVASSVQFSLPSAVQFGGYEVIKSPRFYRMVEGVRAVMPTGTEDVIPKALMVFDGALMKEILVARPENLSPLVSLSSEYSRTLAVFRLAEERAQREFIEAAAATPLEPRLVPSSSVVRPEVQNVFNLMLPEGVELDLRELERRISQILNEQVRRYYGSLP